MTKRETCSFRDPSGYLFSEGEILKRRIFPCYFEHLDHLYQCGLYQSLLDQKLIIPSDITARTDDEIILTHERVPFVPHPSEWCFEMWRDTTLTLLEIQKQALAHGMTLKDANFFNFSPYQGSIVLLDTPSFEIYREGEPWRALQQLLQHFILPMIYATYNDVEILKQAILHHEGWPMEQAQRFLPAKLKFSPSYFLAVFTPIRAILKHKQVLREQNSESKTNRKAVSKKHLLSICETFQEIIRDLKPAQAGEWSNYNWGHGYSEDEFELKKGTVLSWLNELSEISGKPLKVWDTSANTGEMLRDFLKEKACHDTIMTDIDYGAVGHNYQTLKEKGETNNLPLVLDLTNPTPATGFCNLERPAFIQRMKKWKPDAILALAVVHHLSLTYNLTFQMLADFFRNFQTPIIIEFPHQNDYWVEHLLSRKFDFRPHFEESYTKANFERAFNPDFVIEKSIPLTTSRTLFLMTPRKN